MKTINILISTLALIILISGLGFNGPGTLFGQTSHEKVDEAYQVRLQGRADSAEVLLRDITRNEPESAMAWFELSRTCLHMASGNPQKMSEYLACAENAIDTAIQCAPDKTAYLGLKGGIRSLKQVPMPSASAMKMP